MILFDVNILIYAHREDQTHHGFYRSYLESTINGEEPVGLSSLVAGGFVRIVTNKRFPNGPTPLSQALAVVESMIARPNCYWVNPGRRHWSLLADLCRSTTIAGKRIGDAQHAAVAIENACTWVTRDDDFTVFTQHGLKLELLLP